MTDDRMAVLDTVRKAIADGDADFLRDRQPAVVAQPLPFGRDDMGAVGPAR